MLTIAFLSSSGMFGAGCCVVRTSAAAPAAEFADIMVTVEQRTVVLLGRFFCFCLVEVVPIFLYTTGCVPWYKKKPHLNMFGLWTGK